MATVGNIGIGLLILVVLWISTIIIFVIAIKVQSNVAWIALGLSTALTIVLLCIPTKPNNSLDTTYISEKDYKIIYKNTILIVLVLSALAGFLIFFVSICLLPVKPRPFKTFYELH